jgi:hypothetical protein
MTASSSEVLGTSGIPQIELVFHVMVVKPETLMRAAYLQGSVPDRASTAEGVSGQPPRPACYSSGGPQWVLPHSLVTFPFLSRLSTPRLSTRSNHVDRDQKTQQAECLVPASSVAYRRQCCASAGASL